MQKAETTPEEIAKLIRVRANDVLVPIGMAIDKMFPTDDLRQIMWIGIYEEVKARIDAYRN